MALQGRLRDLSLAQLLNLVNLARKSGALRIDGPQGRAHLFFREGKLIYASLDGSDARTGELADVLVRAAVVTPAQIRPLLSQAGSDKELGLLLINAGHVTQEEILQALRTHLLEIVYSIFTWDDGTFAFDPQLDLPAGRIAVPISLESVIFEGRRRHEELLALQAELPSLNVTLRLAEGPEANLRNIQLSVDEWRVISDIGPRRTIAEIARLNQLGEFQIRKIVSKLLRDGLVEIVERAEPKSHPSSPERPLPSLPSSAPIAPVEAATAERGIIRRLVDRIRHS